MVRVKIDGDLSLVPLVQAVSKEANLSQEDAHLAVQTAIDVIGRALAAGHAVKLPNAFTLTPSRRRVAAGSLGGRVKRSHYVKTVKFHLNGRLLEAVRSGRKVTTLKKSPKSY